MPLLVLAQPVLAFGYFSEKNSPARTFIRAKMPHLRPEPKVTTSLTVFEPRSRPFHLTALPVNFVNCPQLSQRVLSYCGFWCQRIMLRLTMSTRRRGYKEGCFSLAFIKFAYRKI